MPIILDETAWERALIRGESWRGHIRSSGRTEATDGTIPIRRKALSATAKQIARRRHLKRRLVEVENDLSTDLDSAYDLIYATGVERGRWREEGEKRGDFRVIPGEAGTHHDLPTIYLIEQEALIAQSPSRQRRQSKDGSTRSDCPGAAPALLTGRSLCLLIFMILSDPMGMWQTRQAWSTSYIKD